MTIVGVKQCSSPKRPGQRDLNSNICTDSRSTAQDARSGVTLIPLPRNKEDVRVNRTSSLSVYGVSSLQYSVRMELPEIFDP